MTLSVRQESYTPVVRFDQRLRDRIAGVLAAAGSRRRCCPPGPGTTPGCSRRGCRRPCCSCATLPVSRIPPPSTPTWPTAKPASAPSPSSWRTWCPAVSRGGRPPYPPLRRWLADLAWLPGQGVRRDVLIEADGERFTSVTPAAPPAPLNTSRALPCPGSPTRTRTPSTVPCAPSPRRTAARSGPGASGCTRSRPGSTPTATSGWPAPCTPRWRWPG